MGATGKSIEVINDIRVKFNPRTVCDLGAQNNYDQPKLPAPYMSEWWKQKGVKEYMSIDLSGENESKVWNLSEPLKTTKTFDLVMDLGTLEHIKDFYQGLVNIDKLTKVGGIIYRENPMTGHWPGHGYHYVTEQFYHELAPRAGYELIRLETHYAMHNYETGGNIIAVMRKTREGFITRDKMPQTFKS